MILHRVEKKVDSDWVRLCGYVTADHLDGEQEIYFQFKKEHADHVVDHADPFIPILWIECLEFQDTLKTELPVSKKLYEGIQEIELAFADWYSGLHYAKVDIPNRVQRPRSNEENAGSTFSAGVDSWYTFLRNRERRLDYKNPINHLLMMAGYEQPLSNDRHGKLRQPSIEKIADYFGVTAFVGESNFRDVLKADVEYQIGASLASAALTVSNQINTWYFPSTYMWNLKTFFSSHPYTDEKWANESVKIYHDGVETGRASKLKYALEKEPEIVLKYMYSCMRNLPSEKCCGKCYKCTRNLIVITLMGLQDLAVNYETKFPKKWQRKYMTRRLTCGPRHLNAELDFALENYNLSLELGKPDAEIHQFLEEFVAICHRLKYQKTLEHDPNPVPFPKSQLHFIKYQIGKVIKPYKRKRESF